MPIGDAQAHNYVVGELGRRTLGRHIRRMQMEPNPIRPKPGQISQLATWWNQKTPWIRAVSNAVPVRDTSGQVASDNMQGVESAKDIFGEEVDDNTRFHHILFGGIAQPNIKGVRETPTDDVTLKHGFESMYMSPFSLVETEESLHGGYKPGPRGLKGMPGITNINVQYKGGTGGGLKKAVVNVKCFSLIDLERLEKLYMGPGIKVLLEWGWSKNTHGTDFGHEQCDPIPLDDKILGTPSAVHTEISKRRKLSGACYDGLFGTITNFNWSVNPDLSFDCRFDLTDIGDSIFTVSTTTPFINKKVADAKKKDDMGYTLVDSLKHLRKKIKDKSGKVKTKTVKYKNTIGSIDFTYFRSSHGSPSKQTAENTDKKGNVFRTYIRFGDIVDKLMNRLYIITSQTTREDAQGKLQPVSLPIASFSIGGADTFADLQTVDDGTTDASGEVVEIPENPVSVVGNHEFLMSIDPDVCLLPGQVGAAPYDVKEAMYDSKRGGGHITSKSFPAGIDADKEFHFNCSKEIAEKINGGSSMDFDETKKTAGLLANVFVNLDMMVEIADSSTDVGSFLRGVTDRLNYACGDIWALMWTQTDEHPGIMTCRDMHFYWNGAVTIVELPVAQLSGILKSLNMKSEINQNLAAKLYISNNSAYTGKSADKSSLDLNTALPIKVDFSLDGISGLQFGTTFGVDYVPSRYREQTYLFASQVSHNISPGGWDTAVTCEFKYRHPDNPINIIRLSNVMDLQESDIGTDQDIACALKEEVPAHPDLKLEKDMMGEAAAYPPGIFQSLDGIGITIGAPDGKVKEGEKLNNQEKDRETIEALRPRLEDVMSKIYGKGTGKAPENIDNARAILMKILYLPVDGSSAAPPPTVRKSKKKRNKKKEVVVEKCIFGYTGCSGTGPWHEEHTPAPEFKYDPIISVADKTVYVMPDYIDIPPAQPDQYFIGPG